VTVRASGPVKKPVPLNPIGSVAEEMEEEDHR